MRKRLIIFFTFLGGLYYFAEFVTPKYVPTSVPTMHRFSNVCRAHGGANVNDTTLAFDSVASAVSACDALGIGFEVPAMLAGRAAAAKWVKDGEILGRIGAELSVDAVDGDPLDLPGWTLEPAFWSCEYRSYESVQTFNEVCLAIGGRLRDLEDGYGAEFDRALSARETARRLGVDLDLPPAVSERAARLTRFEQGRLVVEVARQAGDAEDLFAGWSAGSGRWTNRHLVHAYFMVGGRHEMVSDVFIVIFVAAMFLGLINVLRSHGMGVVMRRKGWGYSLALLLSMVAMIVAGVYDWYNDVAGRKAEELEAQLLAHAQVSAVEAWEEGGRQGDRPVAADFASLDAVMPEKVAVKEAVAPSAFAVHAAHFYRDTLMGLGGVFVGLSSAIFSLLALYIAAAAYRAFRIKSGEAALMMFTALLVMLGQIPMGTAMCNPLFERLGIAGGIVPVRGWIMEVINTAAFRGIYFGSAIAWLAMGIRMWLSMETGSFYKEDD